MSTFEIYHLEKYFYLNLYTNKKNILKEINIFVNYNLFSTFGTGMKVLKYCN